MNSNLSTALTSILNLKQGYTKAYGKAPHKPILFLAIIHEFEKNRISTNSIGIEASLIASFREIWNRIVESPHSPNFSLPFFHLKNEKNQLWTLRTKPGFEKAITSSNSIKSLAALQAFVYDAVLREDVYKCFVSPILRNQIKEAVLTKYFHLSSSNYQVNDSYLKKLEEEVCLSPSEYKANIQGVLPFISKEEYEEERFLRSSAFKKNILNIYNDTCAITGMRVIATKNISMVDACHIVPFAKSYDDTLPNGIALSPTFHRAFDRGLISIDDDYRVLVSDAFAEHGSNQSLSQFKKLKIILPKKDKFLPSQENLHKHRQYFGFS